jgi:peroxiredoxin
MNTRHRPITACLTFALLAGCATSADSAPAELQPPSDDRAAEGARDRGPEPAELDATPAIPLETWRKVSDEGKAAMRTAELTDRIEKCRRFVAQNGEHQEVGGVLAALADAMLETGEYDAAELAGFIEQRCRSQKEASSLPVELVRDYHIKHKLPLESAVRLLDEARARIQQDWHDQVDRETDETAKKRTAAYLSYRKVQTYVLQGRVYLQHGRPQQALDALELARVEAENFQYDIVLRTTSGADKGTLGAGLMDDLHVLTAAALSDLDRKAEATQAFARAVGFVNDVEMREIYDRTRETLGLKSKDERAVTAEALPAQDFTLEDLAGKKVKLSDYRGKVVLITFWATWCGPCKKEMPVLQKFLKANRDKGVEVLAISTDSFTERSKVKPFIEENDLELKVLFEQPEALSGYNYRAIPALYVVDRKGRIAHARTGYDPDLEKKLDNEIAALVSGDGADPARTLFTIEQAPAGFDVRWKRAVTGDAGAIAVAAPLGAAAGEVAILGRDGLMRWSAAGEERPAEPVAGYVNALRSADLDGDGKREWILGGWQSLKVLDAQGKIYWDYKTQRMAEIRGIGDLDGDGFKEIVLEDGDRVRALKSVPEPRWSTKSIDELQAVTLDGTRVLVQADGALAQYDADGKVRPDDTAVPEGRHLRAFVGSAGPDRIGLFGGRWDAEPDTSHDIDGDGRNDIVITSSSGVIVYDADGNSILRIRGNDSSLQATVGDLDGKPGAEVAIFVDHYGVVLLGRKN